MNIINAADAAPNTANSSPGRAVNVSSPMKLSKRKLESYRRAEVVAQASRAYMTAPMHSDAQKAACDLWSGAVMDWMSVTGKLKYDAPKRRGRHR